MLHGGMFALLCGLLHVHTSYSGSLPVPMLMWNNEPQDTPTFVTTGHSQDVSAVFVDRIEPSLHAGKLTLFFLQDELSSDDFVKYSTSFTHLQKVMDTHKNEFLPAVSRGEKSLSELVSGAGGEVEYVDSSSLNDWKYKGKNVVIFNLEPVAGSSSQGRDDILWRNDHVMHIITKTLKQEGKDFDVVYTSEEPSQLVANYLLNEEIADVTFGSRHLLSVRNGTQRKFNNTCVLMYMTSMKFKIGDAEDEFIKDGADWVVGGVGSNNVGCSISLALSGGENFKNITFLMDVRNDTQEFYCYNIKFDYTEIANGTGVETQNSVNFACGANSSAFESPVYNMVRAPNGMSFACHDLQFVNNGSVLTLGGFQMQPKCTQPSCDLSSFGGAYHCVGFFTIPILTGIFVTVVLMMGLYMGIMMMMAIQVQDRYDDPKGKTISVATHGD
jgi:V-type H+-transporting ATPase S1 subunit